MLKAHEGLRLKPYKCPANKLSIGFGRNIEDVGISLIEAEFLLDNDIALARERCEKTFSWFLTMGEARQDVVIMMVFNMGMAKFCTFYKAIAALQKGDWLGASNEMSNSLWARQVGDRAVVLCKMMSSGRYPE